MCEDGGWGSGKASCINIWFCIEKGYQRGDAVFWIRAGVIKAGHMIYLQAQAIAKTKHLLCPNGIFYTDDNIARYVALTGIIAFCIAVPGAGKEKDKGRV
jgi:hypothetical protein